MNRNAMLAVCVLGCGPLASADGGASDVAPDAADMCPTVGPGESAFAQRDVRVTSPPGTWRCSADTRTLTCRDGRESIYTGVTFQWVRLVRMADGDEYVVGRDFVVMRSYLCASGGPCASVGGGPESEILTRGTLRVIVRREVPNMATLAISGCAMGDSGSVLAINGVTASMRCFLPEWGCTL